MNTKDETSDKPHARNHSPEHELNVLMMGSFEP